MAPLLGLSLIAHGLFLLLPLPSRPEAEAEAEPTEEAFVDLLSISSLVKPAVESVVEPDLPIAPPPEAAPPPPQATAPTVPQVPTQPVIPDTYPDIPLPDPTVAEAPALADPVAAEAAVTPTPEPPPAAFVQEEEVVTLFTTLTRGAGDSDFDITEVSFPHAAYATRRGIREWQPWEQACFFTEITADSFRLRPNAVSLRYLARNIDFIQTDDIPRTFAAPEFQLSSVAGGYCDRPLYQVLRQGQPFLFVSVAGVGLGNPQSTGMVVIWSSDPRGG